MDKTLKNDERINIENRNITCIICPKGCNIEVWYNKDLKEIKDIKGHACKRGLEYATAEVINPKRTLTTTVRMAGGKLSMLPVKSDKPLPKDLLFDCMKIINNLELTAPFCLGEVIVENILNTGVNIIATREDEGGFPMEILKNNAEKVLSLETEQLAGLSFDCSCGENHAVDIGKIIIEKGALEKVPEVVAPFKNGKIFLVADNNTYEVAGERVEHILLNEKFDLYKYVFNLPNELTPDASTLGRLLIEVQLGTSLIVAVGSGVINDMCRFLAYKLSIPFIIIGTAPSMDGYASVVTPTVVDGIKATLGGIYPYAIVGDIEILKNAPMKMLYAGFGDILGKINALADWNLARQLHGEDYCEICASFVKNALKKCIDNIDGIKNREDEAIKFLMEALVIAGVSMGMFGNSRPASGAEHHFAHYWDEDAIARGVEHPLHGNSVGVGTVIAAEQYKLLKDKLPVKIDVPDPEEVTNLLKRLGSWYSPADLGISKDLFKRSIIHSKDSRPKYTSSHFAGEIGMLEEIAEILTEKFYG